jgi:hypothetical protein
MDHGTQEIKRVYRLDFNNGEPDWDDPIPSEVASSVLGRKTTSMINRTNLLAWALMDMPQVQVADLAFEGWIMISISPDAHFDELTFKSEVATIVRFVRQVHRDRGQRDADLPSIAGSVMPMAAAFSEAREPL